MRGDKNIRDYFLTPKVVSTPLGEETSNLKDFINSVGQKNTYTFYNFETKRVEGITDNILNSYMPFILDKVECFTKFEFDNYSARLFEFKSRSIAKYLYGDTRLFYFIFLFNDLSHDTDLTYDYLINHGLIMPNISGLELLEKLSTFKTRVETIDGMASFKEANF